MEDGLWNLCSVKEKHFKKIFNEYFRTENIKLHMNNDWKLYSNYEVIKVHLNKPDNIDDFLYNIFENIISFWWQEFNELAKNKKIKYKKSVALLTKYIPELKKKILEELKEWENFIERSNWVTIDEDLASMSKQRELWEIILFFLTEWLMDSPIAVSKIRFKTSNQMPVYWADGVHISKCWKKLLYWESKLTDKFESAKKSWRDSLVKFSWKKPLDYIWDEINIIWDNFDSLDLDKKELIKSIINPYYNEEIKEVPDYELVCFLWYWDKDYEKYLVDNDIVNYEKRLYDKVFKLIKHYWDKETELKGIKITFFLLPFKSIFKLLQKYWLKLEDTENFKNINLEKQWVLIN